MMDSLALQKPANLAGERGTWFMLMNLPGLSFIKVSVDVKKHAEKEY